MDEIIPTCWIDGGGEEDELVRELLDDESPLFLLPEETDLQSNPSPENNNNNQSMDQLVSTFYSGPIIQGIENAFSSITTPNEQFHAASSQARLPIWERNLSKMEDNKYTLKLKCGGNGMADDGYKWRKYGQKSIKNSPYPRSYYRCTNPRCCAKKQVERSREDEDTLIITYEGLHLHFAYPYFLMNQAQPDPYPPTKRPKNTTSESDSQAHQTDTTTATPTPDPAQESSSWADNGPEFVGLERMSPQGLLEDVVPFMVRNPNPSSSSFISNNTYSSSSCSSYRSSPPVSPSSLSWSPTLY